LASVAVLGLAVLPSASRAQSDWVFTKIADTATPVPNGVGNFTSFDSPSLRNGYVTFLANGAGGRQGIYSLAPGGTLQRVADTTTTAPGGGTFSGFERPSVDASGNLAFVATTTTGQGVYARNGGPLSVVANTTTATPGLPGATFSTFTFRGSASIDQGQVAFSAFSGLPFGPFTDGIYKQQGGVLSRVVDRSTTFPYGAGTHSMIFIDRPMISNGDVIFPASTGSGGQNGVYATKGGVLTRLVDNTQNLPGSSEKFGLEGSVYRGPSIAGGRSAYFSVNGFGPATGNYGTDTDGIVKPMITYGTTVPGTSAKFTGIGFLSLDPSGAFAVYADSIAATALWYSPTFTGAGLERIISFSDMLDGKTVQNPFSSIYALSGDQFAFETTFSDGSSGVFLATRGPAAVPEPHSIVLVGVSLLGVLLVKRRARRAQDIAAV
jgi:hypothetical protein